MDTNGVTGILLRLSDGDRDAVNDLLPLVYEELRRLAGSYLRQERSDHTLQPTALVNEAYLKMVDINQISWQNKAHFVAVAANQMRRILVDHARRRNAFKRGGEFHILTLNDEIDKASDETTELIELDDALTELARMDALKAQIVEMRYFGGLTMDEVAEVLGVSVITVKRHWKMTKAWLYGRLAKNS
ncbi:MAG TPA: sigma-70 family RNA polymerase sigma factor [Pyrinomonadaceae bacterium]|nr:sigma-70 family RNA polymerase sigma factor [Pyrinomonadaceae bacterium]